ncbi:hypothetical protein [Massilia sp. BJB1822]|uniref:hypothetical protein n=1 Tax=Massilia sp. BJB1822 TaxID=2744470 RepID=UPI001593FD96|nr:hypothetical protein [Massilia sp. BJB1822]NVD97735.1 hypothetical protein [Massilia sp. BJB1822]
MASQAIKRSIVCAVLSMCAGCAIFEQPQVYPKEWEVLDPAPLSLPPAEREKFSHPPPNMDESVKRTYRLLRHYTIKAAVDDAVPQHVGNFLIGLTALAAYKGLTDPNTKTTAAAATLGTAAYTAGTGVKWGDRATAYNQATDSLICLLNEALPYAIRYQDATTSPEEPMTGSQRMVQADTALQNALTKLDLLLIRYRDLNDAQQVAGESVTSKDCSNKSWNKSTCDVESGPNSAQFRKQCLASQALHAAACAPRKNPALFATPAPEVEEVFATANEVRTLAEVLLKKSGTIRSVSDRMGLRLWTNTLTVMNATNGAIRRTGFDLAELIKQFNDARAAEKAAKVNAKGQLQARTAFKAPLNVKKTVATADGETKRKIRELWLVVEDVRVAMVALNGHLKLNQEMPATLNVAKIDACVSAESKLVLALTLAQTTPPAASAPEAQAKDKLPGEASPKELAALELSNDASDSQIESRIRACQKHMKVTESGKLDVAMQKSLAIEPNPCKGTVWP